MSLPAVTFGFETRIVRRFRPFSILPGCGCRTRLSPAGVPESERRATGKVRVGPMIRSKIFLTLTAALVLGALAGCGNDGAAVGKGDFRARAVPIVVEPLRFDSARTRLEAVGTSRALQSIEIHPATSGEVIAVNFAPGEQVAQGEVLVELERREEELAVALAEVRLEDANRLYDRYLRSADSGAVLPTTVDAARTAVDSAEIELERAKVALDYRTIRAPFAGYVGITEVDPGDRINPDTVVTTLDNRSALLVSFEVPESLSGEVAVGDEVSVAPWNAREPAARGTVEDIGSRIDPETRTFVVRARVGNDSDALRPGMSFRVGMNLVGTPFPVVAETAVQWGADGAYVWWVTNGTVERVPVSIVQRKQGSVLIDTQLENGSLIVVEGTQRMRSGVEVSYDAAGLASRDGGGAKTRAHQGPEAD